MTSDFYFSAWPPFLYKDHQKELILHATSYALSHGLLYLPQINPQPSIPTSAIHAPISLFPAPFPRKSFELAQRLQRIYNVLYARIAMDEEFLDSVMGATDGVGQVDEFVGQLWTGWKKLRDGKGGGGGEGSISQVCITNIIYISLVQRRGISAPSIRYIQIRLSSPYRKGRYFVPETSRIQHHLCILRSSLRTYCRNAPVSFRIHVVLDSSLIVRKDRYTKPRISIVLLLV